METIAQFVIEVIFIQIIGGTIARVNHGILKLRGLETRKPDEIEFDKLKKRYEYRKVILKSNYENITKGTIGTVLELVDTANAIVKFENKEEAVVMPLNKVLVKGVM